MMRAWVLVSAAGLLQINSALAERYQVVQDRFGNLDAEVSVQEPSVPAESSSSSINALSPSKAASVDNATVLPLPVQEEAEAASLSPTETPAVQTDSAVSAGVIESASEMPLSEPSELVEESLSESPSTPTISDKPARSLSKFEKIFLENEGRNPYDATVVKDEDFVDADAVLEGRVDSPSQQPFFITRDPDGNENVTFYSPSLAKEAKEQRALKLSYSKATIYRPDDTDGVYIEELPASADPMAVQILTGGKGRFENYFDSFSKRCCSALPKAGVKTIEFGRSEHLRVLEETLPYRFHEGDSRYLIFKLPDSAENFAIQLRAFIKEFRGLDIDHGVFYPQIVMLDINLQPLRIIANPVLEFTPESWSNYGYLQGVFEVDRTEGREEVYALLNTTRDALKKASQYDYEAGRITIRHMKFGELGVKAVAASELIQP